MTAGAASGAAQGFAPLRLVDRWLRPIETAAAIVGGVMMVAAMGWMTVDAFMRYLFTSPSQIAPRLIEFYFMVGMFAMPLAWGFRTGGYIRIIGAVALLPVRLRNTILRLGLLASSVYVSGLTWTSWGRFHEAWETQEVYVSAIDWNVAWSWIWVPVGLGLLALRLVLMAFGPAEDLSVTHSEGT